MLDIVDFGGRQQIHLNHALESLDLPGQLKHLLQGRGIEDAIAMLLVDHPQNDHVVQIEFLLYLVVENADELFFRKHVFRIGVDLDFGNLETQRKG